MTGARKAGGPGRRRGPAASLAAACAFAALAAPSRAQTVEAPHPSLALQTVSILVGFGPAQGNDQPARPEAAAIASTRMSPDMSYDQTARFLARRLGAFLPGAPSIVARHTPGGAGLAAARLLYAAKPDGGTIGLLSSNVIFASALKLHDADAPMERFVWLGGVAPDAWACIRTQASKDSARPWAGSLGIGSRSDVHARAMGAFFDYPLRIASGYVSRFELVRAIENGEVDMACGWPLTDLERRRAAWFDNGRMEVVQLFDRSTLAATRGASVSEAALRLLLSETELAWPLAAPPGTPGEIAAAFGGALDALAHDPEAIAEAQRAGIALDPVSAARVTGRVQALAGMGDAERSVLLPLFAGPGR